jgi:RHS repeat-associated protein
MAKAKVFKDGEEATVRYLHNALGQRVFQGEPTASQTLPNQETLGQGFIDWLKSNFAWMFANAQATTSIGTAFVYADGYLPSWAILGDYDNGSASGNGRSEYIWLPTGDGAIPVGLFRNGRFFAIHTDHLGTPRLMTNDVNKPVWQWPYSAFGTTKPTGMLNAKAKPKNAMTNQPVMLKGTGPGQRLDLRHAGQYFDVEAGTFYNYLRDSYDPLHGRYRQSDPIRHAGGMNFFIYVEGNPLSMTDPLGLMGQGSGGNARGPRTATPAGANASVGAGFSGHTPFGFGIGIDGGIARDTTGNTCFYSNVCYTVGPGMSAAIGAVGSVGSGPLSSGTTEYNGACWSGGTGVGGSGSVLFGKDGSAQMGRGLYGPSAGGSATYQSCRLQLICARN